LLARLDAAGEAAPDHAAALQAMFLAHTGFVAEHPGVPRLLFGELQRAGSTAPKRVAAALLAQYAERLRRQLEQGRQQREFDPDLDVAELTLLAPLFELPAQQREFDPDLDVAAAATLFIGSVQGLVMQALIAGDVQRIRDDAPRVLAIYLRGIRARTAS